MFVALLLGLASVTLLAQDAPRTPTDSPHRRPLDNSGPRHRPPSPLMEVLDTNHDEILSAEKIANATASLKKLDKNEDGRLTEDELRPPPRPGGPGEPPLRRHGGTGDSSGITPDEQSPDQDARQNPVAQQAGLVVGRVEQAPSEAD